MKAYEIVDALCALAPERDYSGGVDSWKAGDPETEASKVAVTMFATPNVIKAAREWGAQLLITHEPTYYNNADQHSNEAVEVEKRRLIEASGMALYRYHDHTHYTSPDIIAVGTLNALGLSGSIEYTDTFDLVRLTLDTPMTALELARHIEKKLNIRRVSICGERNKLCTKISCMFGAPGNQLNELRGDLCEIVLTGEAWEWMLGEYARDAAELGYNKSVIFMGHIGSEREGMKYTAQILQEKFSSLDVRYFECGEVRTYTDSNN